MDKNCLFGFITLAIVIIAIVAMFLNYKAKFDRRGVELEKNDQQHNHRLQELEKKNGKEMKKIVELEKELQELKKLIKS